MASIDSASDDRTVNNTMRHAYRVLSDAEKANMQAIKDAERGHPSLPLSGPGERRRNIATYSLMRLWNFAGSWWTVQT